MNCTLISAYTKNSSSMFLGKRSLDSAAKTYKCRNACK